MGWDLLAALDEAPDYQTVARKSEGRGDRDSPKTVGKLEKPTTDGSGDETARYADLKREQVWQSTDIRSVHNFTPMIYEGASDTQTDGQSLLKRCENVSKNDVAPLECQKKVVS